MMSNSYGGKEIRAMEDAKNIAKGNQSISTKDFGAKGGLRKSQVFKISNKQ